MKQSEIIVFFASFITKQPMMNALSLASSQLQLKQMQSASASSMQIKVFSNLITKCSAFHIRLQRALA
jgi:hypothetical protein